MADEFWLGIRFVEISETSGDVNDRDYELDVRSFIDGIVIGGWIPQHINFTPI